MKSTKKDVQDEIRRRIIKRDAELRRARQESEQTEATVAALSEVTELSAEEMRDIAHRVRQEVTHSEGQDEGKWVTWLFGSVVGILVLYLLIASVM